MATLFDSVSMERPDPSAEDLAAASASVPSTLSSPQQGAPTLPAIEDKKEDDAVALERLSAKEWEQADGLLKKAEAAVEKLKKERERERERERVCVCVCAYAGSAVARDPLFLFCFFYLFCVMHQHYEGCDEADREDQAQQRRPPDLEAAPWLLFPIVRTHETTDAVPSCIYKEDPHPRLDRQEEHAGARQELPGPRAETDEAATFLCLRQQDLPEGTHVNRENLQATLLSAGHAFLVGCSVFYTKTFS